MEFFGRDQAGDCIFEWIIRHAEDVFTVTLECRGCRTRITIDRQELELF
jgi:hypothetical protein